MKFIITIDTEGDNQWDHGRDLTVENIKYVPRFQELCRKYGISPVYLVTSEICNDALARELFTGYIKKGEAEIGAHLHSWTTPPFFNHDGFRENDPDHAFASELPYDLLNQKLSVLTRSIEDSFGKRPTSFRSGRYGFNGMWQKHWLKMVILWIPLSLLMLAGRNRRNSGRTRRAGFHWVQTNSLQV